ncbi:MAG TPA: thiamine-binding protein, partial [Acidimicrobiales bacterium]|nr:thiamine-binding protein [Acidimicrobiales bacterium]
MRQVRVEFTVEPFREGDLGAHVDAAIRSLRAEGFDPEVGPFGTVVEGDAQPLLEAVSRAALASFDAGASGIALTARSTGGEDVESFLAAVRPAVRALGGRLVPVERMGRTAVPLVWRGRVVGGLERPGPNDLRNGLASFVAQIESELGGRLATLSRVDKQRAVRMLDERGAFAIRNAVDE